MTNDKNVRRANRKGGSSSRHNSKNKNLFGGKKCVGQGKIEKT
jgi:hypothetical protein